MKDSKGRFIKGTHPSPKTEFKKGQPKSENWYKSVLGRKPWNKGLTKKDPRILKNIQGLLSINKKGFRRSPQTEFKKGLIPWNKGKTHMQGKNHPNWKGGLTPINRRIRTSSKYLNWRKTVFERDNYTCQNCHRRGGEIQVDHIKPFALYPELRFEIPNGRTLCKECHNLLGWSLFKENNPRCSQGGTLNFVYRPRYL